MRRQTLIALALAALPLAACTKADMQTNTAVTRGKALYQTACAQCHGSDARGGGAASLGLGVPAPDLAGLRQRDDGYFPREFVRRFVLGMLEKDDPDAAMPDFSQTGLRHGSLGQGSSNAQLSADLDDLLTYLETIQD